MLIINMTKQMQKKQDKQDDDKLDKEAYLPRKAIRKATSQGLLGDLFANNQKWAKQCLSKDPLYFQSLIHIQKPEYLWIGCADSRVPANAIVGLKSGQLFVHRNVANVVSPSDICCTTVVNYAVQALKVKHIIVCGHYNCGGVNASITKKDFGNLETWLSHIRIIRQAHKQQLKKLENEKAVQRRMVELNVIHQVSNVAKIASVQRAWHNGEKLSIHGLVYNLEDGLLKIVSKSIRSLQDLSEEFKLYQ